MSFLDLCRKHGTDKGDGHRYDFAYELLLKGAQWGPTRIVEIGVANGASLAVWDEWFPNSEIWGIDIDPAAVRFAGSGINIVIGDQGDPAFWERFTVASGGNFHLVVDDGSHRWDHQQITFAALWPHVRPGGLYVIEDLESSILQFRRSKQHRANPTGKYQATLPWLFDRVQQQMVLRGGHKEPTPMYCFASEAVFIVKP